MSQDSCAINLQNSSKKSSINKKSINNSAKFLPSGFYDLIFEEAELSRNLINLGLDYFLAKNFKLVETSLVEFEEDFQNFEFANNRFFLVDPISGKKLYLRRDITLQIARLLNSRLKNYQFPLRLCYVGDVFCAQNNELFFDRKQTQLGFEIIGENQAKSYLETLSVLLGTLQKFGLGDLNLVISLPNLLDDFLKILQEEENYGLKSAILHKNFSKISEFGGKNAEFIKKLITEDFTKSFEMKFFQQEIFAKSILQAKEIAKFLDRNFSEIAYDFDIFGDNLANYHHNLAFDIFAKNFIYPIARGGDYQISPAETEKNNSLSAEIRLPQEQNLESDQQISAIGATIYINFLMRILESIGISKKI